MAERERRVPTWMGGALRLRPAGIPVGHTVRAALCVGAPAALGFALDDVVTGVTVALACVLRTVGERPDPFAANVRSLLVATPIGACGYVFGYAEGLPLPALVGLMAVVAFAAGVLAGRGGALALGSMQLLLITSVAIGVPDAEVGRTVLLFFGGAALYLACLAVDAFVFEPGLRAGAPRTPAGPSSADPGLGAVLDPALLRQAGRLALSFAVAVSARGWVDLQHWFWVPATVGLVMQPSFGSVPGRAVERAIGTVLGAVVAACVLVVVPDGVGLGLAMGLLAATIPWAKLASYALQSAGLAAVVVLLVDQVSPSAIVGLPVQRVLATVVGGAIVLVFGFLVWPEARRIEAEAQRAAIRS